MIYDDSQNILFNIKFLFDSMFLRDGHFKNVAKGSTIRSVDISKLVRDESSDSYFAGVSGAQVWQSPFQEWVYESGITMNDAPYISGLTPPTVASGIYVNGTFFSKDIGVSGNQFYIDFINGRVIFIGNGIPQNSLVQAEYAYRTFRVDFSSKYTNADIDYYAQTELKDNPFSNDNPMYPSGGFSVGTMPAVFLELGEDNQEAYELGNRSSILNQPIYCFAYSYDTIERNTMLGLIRTRWHIQMPMIDFNYAPLPLSGIYSTLSPEYIPFQTMLQNIKYKGNNVISKYYYIDSIRTRPEESLGKLERGVATVEISLFNIAPTGRIAQNPYI